MEAKHCARQILCSIFNEKKYLEGLFVTSNEMWFNPQCTFTAIQISTHCMFISCCYVQNDQRECYTCSWVPVALGTHCGYSLWTAPSLPAYVLQSVTTELCVTLRPVGMASWRYLPPQMVAWPGCSPTCESWCNTSHQPTSIWTVTALNTLYFRE
jgi:hypothetical protein